ncbi:uncharacterized protein MONOS_4147 [Monocercomonoides exilis]|uniref:uncharacterized protein n=2 Tax=Monocercomonoides exilis TaxID=2049356 RepID=UPI00355A4A76|nr:hypothetical protein MONOS_4147 [Monocercomonoides exilis]|eukprot:MONOS_4147.1-p1 / transcript=MONOS_4147.1 / gene=MONOS_4147 / organism=Monocercomonoides_exilis_PA203 / gene_product=unspecified product / transcript_product=unspecified product / location=Mono_scaffold00106:72036-72371(+) / protein_length=112 / sequence_SO=supercontig / SO=protein_coding / is_pseudo=false
MEGKTKHAKGKDGEGTAAAASGAADRKQSHLPAALGTAKTRKVEEEEEEEEENDSESDDEIESLKQKELAKSYLRQLRQDFGFRAVPFQKQHIPSFRPQSLASPVASMLFG